MKKVIVGILLLGLFVSLLIFIVSPSTLYAKTSAECNADHETCREYALNSEEGFVVTTLMLTTCDIAWGWCQIIQ